MYICGVAAARQTYSSTAPSQRTTNVLRRLFCRQAMVNICRVRLGMDFHFTIFL